MIEESNKYKILVENSQDIVALISETGLVRYVSPSIENVLGYFPVEMTGKNGFDFLHPDDSAVMQGVLNSSLQNPGAIRTVEFRYRHKNGGYIDCEVAARNLLHDPGIKGIIIDIRDVTKRKQAEEAVKESEKRLRDFAEELPEIIFETDNFGKVSFANQNAFTKTGYTIEQFMKGLNALTLVIPEEKQKLRKHLSDLIRGRKVDISEYTVVNADGSTFPALLQSSPVMVRGETRGFRGIVVDITKLKRAEEARSEREEIFRCFMEYSPIYVFFKDKNIRALQLSKNYETMMGKPLAELIGKNMFDLFPSELAKSMVADDIRILNEGKTVIVEEEFNGRFYSTTKFPIFIKEKPRYLSGFTIDITERKQAEKALRESEERFRKLANATWEGIIIHRQGIIIDINEAASIMIGYSIEEALGKNVIDFLAPESREPALQKLGEGSTPGQLYLEVKILKKDKSIIFAEVLGRPIKYKNFDARVIAVRDVTERKQSEKALRESEKKYRQLVENLNEGIWVIDKDSNTTFANSRMAEMLGYTAEEMLGKHLFSFMSKEGKKIAAEKIRRRQQGIKERHDFEFFKKDGTRIYASLETAPITDDEGNYCGAIAGVHDITERRRIEETLRTKDRAIESAIEAIAISDLNGCLVYVNPAFLKMWGYDSLAEVLGKSSTEFWQMGEKAVEVMDALAIREGWVGEMTAKSKDGRFFDVQVVASMVVDEDNKSICMLGSFADITERKQAQKALLVAERLSAVGELAAGVAHDFNNALFVITGNLDLALSTPYIPREAADHLEAAQKSANAVAARIRQLQRFARKESNVKYVPLGINQLIAEAISQTKPLWKDESEKNGVKISILTSYGELERVDGDSGELGSVFYNLIKNAIEAMPNGGTIIIETSIADKEVLVRITDTGVGMNEEIKKRAFQPFFTTKGFEAGRGLGMSAMLSVMREHGGKISITKTAIGKGTTIELLFPFGKQCTEEKRMARNAKQTSARVLWVDDEPEIRNVLKHMITQMNHHIDVADSGLEAIQLLEKNQYDVMFTDIGMPGMSGWQLAKAIKGKYSGMKVAVVTGWGIDVPQEQLNEHGVGYLLGKPLKMQEIERLIEEALQSKI